MIQLQDEILQITGAASITAVESVQTLWSGYGEIRRYQLAGGNFPSVIVKHIQWPDQSNHPRGWNTETSHLRKLKSYQVEKIWYERYAAQANEVCKLPQVLHVKEEATEILLIMEDLNASGYSIRLNPGSISINDAKLCLTWLAHFHAQFMQVEPKGLWPVGTYWHLDTRPDEWNRMENIPLKQAAQGIDWRLSHAKFQTLVHGDAKLANFCFHPKDQVAAVDFQYVGKGAGVKDVAYFISSCFSELECARYEPILLNHYFEQLEAALNKSIDFKLLKQEWLELYPYAWADFYRFLDGWSPGHWKMHEYSEQMVQRVLNELKVK